MAYGSLLYRKVRGRMLFGDRHCFREELAEPGFRSEVREEWVVYLQIFCV